MKCGKCEREITGMNVLVRLPSEVGLKFVLVCKACAALVPPVDAKTSGRYEAGPYSPVDGGLEKPPHGGSGVPSAAAENVLHGWAEACRRGLHSGCAEKGCLCPCHVLIEQELKDFLEADFFIGVVHPERDAPTAKALARDLDRLGTIASLRRLMHDRETDNVTIAVQEREAMRQQRDALALKLKGEIRHLHLQDGVVVVVMHQDVLPRHTAERLRRMLNDTFPDNRVVILDGGVRVSVLGSGEESC